MAKMLRTILKGIKVVPYPAALWKEHRLKLLFLLVFILVLERLGKESFLAWDAKDAIADASSIGVLFLLYLILWSARLVLEHRPSPLERRSEIKELAATVLFAKQPGEQSRRLSLVRSNTSRIIRTADTSELVSTMTRLNCDLFSRSVHGQNFGEKLERNLAHMRKNSRVIRLLGMSSSGILNLQESGDDSAQEFQLFPAIGFSHIIPINQTTYNQYVVREKSGPGIEDVDFSAEYICAPNEKAHAFLIFTIAIDPALIKRWELNSQLGKMAGWRETFQGSRSKLWHMLKTERELYIMALEHISELAQRHTDPKQECLILAQAFKRRAEGTLLEFGFQKLEGARTADNEPLYQLKLRFD
jgi:hypothetical protein